jgi:hypothetical protein
VVGGDAFEITEADARLDAAARLLHAGLTGRFPSRMAAAGAVLLIEAARRHLRRVTR